MKMSIWKTREAGLLIVICVLAAAMAGCGKEEKTAGKLTICTDDAYDSEIETIARIWEKINDGAETDIVVIPQDPSLAETKIKQLRTEMMSGGGPDIFVMSTRLETMEEEPSMLFPNPEKTMRSDFFLPLDDYIADAQYMNRNDWNQKIMDAGKTAEGQIILPIAYTYYAYSFYSEDLKNLPAVPDSWEDLKNWKEPEAVENLISQVFLWFSQTFGKLADYEKDTLLFSEEELMNRVEEVFVWRNENRVMEGQIKVSPAAGGMVENAREFWKQVVRTSGEEETIIPIPNDENGLTAYITLYAAVNRNTEYPDQAFSLLDFMFGEDMMSGKGVIIDNSEIYFGAGNNFSLAELPTNKTAVQQILRNQKVTDWYEEVENKINNVRFYSDLDNALCQMVHECSIDEYGPSPSMKKKQEIVIQTYEKMRMMLAE